MTQKALGKIVLVNPPLSGWERYGPLARAGVYMPPLGLGSLAGVAKKRGFEVHILDCEALTLSIDEAIRHIFALKPDYVGITAVTVSINSAANLAKEIKRMDRALPVILGGAHMSAVPEESMNLFPQFDVGIMGEGEITFVELLEALRQERGLCGVTGLIYRENGRLVKTQTRPLIEDLDTLPFPAWELYPDLKKYYRPSAFGFMKLPCTSLITSRGCPSRCSFCNQGPWGRKYREHSARYTVEMVKILYDKYGIRDLAIYDGTFGINKPRLIEFCERLIKEKLDLAWSCNARVNMLTSEILRLMKKAGCWGIAYGIESGSQEVLDFLKKGINLEEISKALRITKKAGIITKGYIMVGTLTETRSSIRKTLDFVLGADLDLLTVNHFTPFPGTLDYDRADLYGNFDRDWSLLNQHNMVFVPKGLTKQEIEHSIQYITRKFYLRPKVLIRYSKMAWRPNNFKLLMAGLASLLKFIGSDSEAKIFIKIPRGKVYFSLRAAWRALTSILTGQILEGKGKEEFEDRFARYVGADYAIASPSGKVSLYLCLKALKVQEGDEVILSAYTVPEVVTMILCAGAKPVFVDIDQDTYNINVKFIERKITKKTKFILMTHLYGRPCDIEPILEIATRYNLRVIEDAAQACGAEYKQKKVGTFGKVAYFSFGRMKNLNTLWGSMITTNDKNLADAIKVQMKNFKYPSRISLIKQVILSSAMASLTHPYLFTFLIYPFVRLLNSLKGEDYLYNRLSGRKQVGLSTKSLPKKLRLKFTNLQAKIGLEQFKVLDRDNRVRIENAQLLTESLKDTSIKLPSSLPYAKNIYLNYVIQIPKRKKAMSELLKRGVDTTNGYIESCWGLPVSDALAKDNLYLPVQPPLGKKEMLYIAKSLKQILRS